MSSKTEVLCSHASSPRCISTTSSSPSRLEKPSPPLLLLLSRFSRVRLLASPWTAAYQGPPPMGFSRQEYWSGLRLPSPRPLTFPKPNPALTSRPCWPRVAPQHWKCGRSDRRHAAREQYMHDFQDMLCEDNGKTEHFTWTTCRQNRCIRLNKRYY